MNYGRRGIDLLLDLKRSCDFLPPYDDDGVRSTLQEISLHHDEMMDHLNAASGRRRKGSTGDQEGGSKKKAGTEVPHESRPAIILHDASIRRNKQCLLAYHSHRADKLRSLRWETSAALPGHVRPLLSEAELDFFAEYDRLVSRYGASVDLDLGADRTPPEEERITVRVVRAGLGRIATDYGDGVELDVGTIHHLPRGDVEHLVRQGALVQLDGEECS